MRVLVAIGGLLVASNLAWAADLPPASYPAPATYAPAPPPPYNWGGIYIGVNGGYGWASASGGTSTITTPGLGAVTNSSNGKAPGGIAGGQVGFNWQSDMLVIGAEADMQWSGQVRTTPSGCGVGCTITEKSGLTWFSTVRARVGAAFDRVLIYGTGGLAILNTSDKVSVAAPAVSTSLVSLSDTPLGFAAGAGVEYAVTNNVLAKFEYLYMQANSSMSGQIAVTGGTVSENSTLKDSVIRAGVNVKFP